MIGFIDVGGGTRGIFGAGILDYCMDEGITADFFIGVSAGAANGVSFVGGQRGRNLVYYNEYAFRKEYMGKSNFLKTGSYIALDYIYQTLSNEGGEYPVDYEAFAASPMDIEIVATNAVTGEPHYFPKNRVHKNHYEAISASCCVPVICKPYFVDGVPYFDGGISDPIPYKRAFEAGCDKLIVILTKPRDLFRTPERDTRMSKLLRRKYPNSAAAFAKRAEVYNRSLREILELEKQGKLIIIAPDDIGKLKTLTQDHEQLLKMYDMGYKKAEVIKEYLR